MGEIYRIGGDDGDMLEGDFGTEKIGDATDTLDELAGGAIGSHAGKGLWLVTGKATTGSIFGTVPVGAVFPADGDEVPIVGDKAKFGAFASVGYLVKWDASIAAKEIDKSLLRDKFDFSGIGKMTFEGNVDGQQMIGETDKPSGMMSRFFPMIRKTAAGVVSYTPALNKARYVLLYVRYSEIPGEHAQFIFASVNLFGWKGGASSGSTQTWSSKMKLDGTVSPCFVDIENPAA